MENVPRVELFLPHATRLEMILILSSDPVAAALLGAWIETLGHAVHFAGSLETAEWSIRRARPSVCLLDCEDATLCNAEVIGRTAMRGIPVIVFGTSRAIERVRPLASEHEIDALAVPADASIFEATVKRAVQRAG